MKLIIAGSRSIQEENLVKTLIDEKLEEKDWNPSEIVVGGADGVDSIAEEWAKENNIDVKVFEADWSNTNHEDAVIKESDFGVEYDASAGPRRNQKIAEYGDKLYAIWNGESKGTQDMLTKMEKSGKEFCYDIVGTAL